jgi:hypothetical protein
VNEQGRTELLFRAPAATSTHVRSTQLSYHV